MCSLEEEQVSYTGAKCYARQSCTISVIIFLDQQRCRENCSTIKPDDIDTVRER